MAMASAAVQLTAVFQPGNPSEARPSPGCAILSFIDPIVTFGRFAEGHRMLAAFVWVFFLAIADRVDLVDEVYQIPGKEWRYIEVGLEQRRGEVSARFESETPAGSVRLALMRRDELERLRQGLSHRALTVTEAAESGRLDFDVPAPGDYAL